MNSLWNKVSQIDKIGMLTRDTRFTGQTPYLSESNGQQ